MLYRSDKKNASSKITEFVVQMLSVQKAAIVFWQQTLSAKRDTLLQNQAVRKGGARAGSVMAVYDK
jgi:hypothetical protein